ncbi:MAG: NAD(+)/NADH kinase [Candidatus Pacebacteria bacterium]|nr:NAD(+)/NADH kinase [Candidatus Paceibacterota bacterium]
MKKIGIIFNKERKPETEGPSLKIAKWLKKNKHKAFINPDEKTLDKGLDFIVTVGGDGTVLRTADRIMKYKIPLVGINFGHKGFLCDIKVGETYDKIKKILEGKYIIEKRSRVCADVISSGKKIKSFDALNEITIGGISRTVFLEMKVSIEKRVFKALISGDGVIISTKTGSTGYNINAGGPMLMSDVFSVVANNANFDSDHLMRNTKSFIISTRAVFEIKILNVFKENLPSIIADGQRDCKIAENNSISIRKSKNHTYFIKIS